MEVRGTPGFGSKVGELDLPRVEGHKARSLVFSSRMINAIDHDSCALGQIQGGVHGLVYYSAGARVDAVADHQNDRAG